MSDRTAFADLTVLDRGEPISEDSFGLQSRNPVVIDQLLEIACVTHRHDAHAALANPTLDPDPVTVLTTGGTIPADTALSVGYTLIDRDGGETVLNTSPAVTSTQAGLDAPTDGPICDVDNVAGTLMADTYYYAVTVTDGTGGETAVGPTTQVTVDPGFANSQVLISGLTDLVTESGGTGWRLWRMRGFSQWALLDEGASDTFTDDGSHCLDCSQAPPTTSITTNATNSLEVTVPAGQPAEAVSFAIYVSVDGDFVSPCLMDIYPIAEAGTVKTLRSLDDLFDGEPPTVSRALPGANRIDPDTDLLDWTWKRPVADEASLPASGNEDGDARVALDTSTIFVWSDTGRAWTAVRGGGGGAEVVGWVEHGAVASTVRPRDFDLVVWVGTVEPENWVEPDVWLLPEPDGGGVDVRDGTTTVTGATDVVFAGGGGVTVDVTDEGGGLARVEVSAPAGPDVRDGTTTVADATDIVFAGAGGTTVDVTDGGGGVARVEITAPAGSGIDVTDGTTTVRAADSIRVIASGDATVEVTDLGSGDAQITVGATGGGGGGWAEVFNDDFSSDRLASDYTLLEGSGLTVAGGLLTPSSTGLKTLAVRTFRRANVLGQVKFHHPSVDTEDVGIFFRGVDRDNIVFANLFQDGSSTRVLTIQKRSGGTYTTIERFNLPSNLTQDTDYWLRAMLLGKEAIVEVWTMDPDRAGPTDVPLYELYANNKTTDFAYLTGYGGLRVNPATTTGVSWDDLIFREQGWS